MRSSFVNLQAAGSDQAAQTPDWLLERLNEEFEFDYDPCPAEWSSDSGWSGLETEWGMSNYVNPPYDQCGPWLAKGVQELQRRGATSVFLVPARPWTVYWRENVWPYASEVRLLDRGVAFKGYSAPLPLGLALVVYLGPSAPLRVMDQPCRPVRLWDATEATLCAVSARLASVYGEGRVRLLGGSLADVPVLIAGAMRSREPLAVLMPARTESPNFQLALKHADDVFFLTPVLRGDSGRLFTGSCVAVFDDDLVRRASLPCQGTMLCSPYIACE